MHLVEAMKKAWVVESSLTGSDDHERAESILLSQSQRNLRARPMSLKPRTQVHIAAMAAAPYPNRPVIFLLESCHFQSKGTIS
jgi:hypothetical protein